MKMATAPQDVTLSDDFEQRDVAVGDIAFILDMFADKVYSHKERAVIRELACNAHDSHVMAGTEDTAFDVHLPTHLEPWFSLRDYGTGLADEDIANIYSAIGVSTKRESNEVIGCFGIGSLSPYSMCDSFTVKSYLNGIVRTYQCMRDEKRQPKVIPLGSASTDEPSGFEDKLSIDKTYIFQEEAVKVFMFWEGTLPNINSQSVTRRCQHMRDKYVFKGDNFGLTSVWGDMYAVMGNIAYKIPSGLDDLNVDGYLKFELGELDFDTARENLSMTDKTKEAVKAKFQLVKNSLQDIAIEQIEAKATTFEKARLAENFSSGRLGRFIGRKNIEPYLLPEAAELVTYWQSKHRGSEKYHTKEISATGDVAYYLHKDRMQARIRSYLKDMDSGHTMYLFKDLAQALECNIPAEMLEDLDDLPKVVRVPSGNAANKCKTLKFCARDRWGHNDSSYWDETEIELDGSEIVYIEVSRNKPTGCDQFTNTNRSISSSLGTAKDHIGEINLIGLKTAFFKTAAFRKGNFIHLDAYLKREYAKIAPKTFFKYKISDLNKFKEINKAIDNDEVREIIELAESCQNDKVTEICNNLGLAVEIVEDTMLQDIMDEWNERHAMLKFASLWDIKNNPEVIAKYISENAKE